MERHNVISKKENIEFFFNSVKKRLEENIISLKKDINSRDIMNMQIGCSNSVSYLLFLEKSKDEIYQYIYYALQFGINHFKQALNPGKEITLNIGESQVKAMGYETKKYIDNGTWQNLFILALILRDKYANEFLRIVPNDFMKNAAVSSDVQDFAVVDVLKSYFNEVHLSKAIQTYWEAKALAKGQTILRKKHHSYLTDPFIKTIESIVAQNEKEFNSNLEKALLQHKEFFTQKNKLGNPGDPYGWLSYNLMSACCYAHDIGMNIEIESDYLPNWMIKGDFSGCVLSVK